MRVEECDMCGGPFNGPAYLVDATRRRGRRRFRCRALICEPCYMRGRIDPDTHLVPLDSTRTAGRFEWHPWPVGRGQQLPPTPCANCGLVVVRHGDPLLKQVTCSRACATSLTRTRNGGKGSGQPCESCGQPVTTGRTDSRYCAPACRQKAYRQRKAHAQP